MPQTPPKMPLSGVRVLDLSRILAAPWAAQMLGDLGAEVIKIERPGSGDDARRFGPPFLQDSEGKNTAQSAFFIAANRNKKSVTVNIATPEGQSIIRDLALKSDVLIENYKVGDLKRYGLDYESLHALNPRLVYCSVTGFGQTGPYAARPGYDTVFQAMGGLMSTTGLPDGVPGGGPMKTGPSLADILAGNAAMSAILAALYHRDTTSGQGQHLDVSLLDCVISAMSHYASAYLVGGMSPPRRGTEGNGGMPSRIYACADQNIVIVAGNNEQYARLAEVLNRPDMVTRPEFGTIALRGQNRDTLAEIMEPAIAQWQAADLLAALDAAGVPAGPVNDMSQVFADPHVRTRQIEVAVPDTVSAKGQVRLVGNPVKYSDTPVQTYSAPPTLGADTAAVLTDILGMSQDKLDQLQRSGAI